MWKGITASYEDVNKLSQTYVLHDFLVVAFYENLLPVKSWSKSKRPTLNSRPQTIIERSSGPLKRGRAAFKEFKWPLNVLIVISFRKL